MKGLKQILSKKGRGKQTGWLRFWQNIWQSVRQGVRQWLGAEVWRRWLLGGIGLLLGVMLLMLWLWGDVRLPQANSQRKIGKLRLSNGLSVMLISDKRFSNAGVALAARAGHWHNPAEHAGLAHFLEHMLFLGTEKYPGADEYQRYLTEYSGHSNAYTAEDHVNYHLQVAPQGLEGALDRFSQFFIAPLLSEEYVSRELQIVDSEHAKNRSQDSWRAARLMRLFYLEDVRSRFYTGDANKLAKATSAVLRDFWQQYYSADKMYLAISAPHDLGQLKDLARKYFSSIPQRSAPNLALSEYFLQRKQALRLVRMRSISDESLLMVDFSLPHGTQYRRQQPLQAAAFVLGHEGKGSLLSLLKQDGLAVGLQAGGSVLKPGGSSLSIQVQLTPQGVEKYPQVLGHIMGALNALKAQPLPDWFFKQQLQLAKLSFQFNENIQSLHAAVTSARSMNYFSLKELPRALHGPTQYDAKRTQEILQQASPERMLVMLIDRNLSTNATEPDYGTPYSYQELTGETYQALLEAKPDPRWHLPQANPFIAKDTKLLKPSAPAQIGSDTLARAKSLGFPPQQLQALQALQGKNWQNYQQFQAALKKQLPFSLPQQRIPLTQLADPLPTNILDTPLAQAWHIEDWKLRSPKAVLLLNFILPNHGKNRRAEALSKLYTQSVLESLNELGYPLRIAGIQYQLRYSKNGILLQLQGYADQLPPALPLILEHMQHPQLNPQRFVDIQRQQIRSWKNLAAQPPSQQLSNFIIPFLIPRYHHHIHLAQAAQKFSLKHIQNYAQQLFRSFQIRAVIAGNLSPQKATQMLNQLLHNTKPQPLPPNQLAPDFAKAIPTKKNWRFQYQTKSDNALAGIYYQLPASSNPLQTQAAVSIAAQTLNQRFFHQLRTQQQLGYSAHAFPFQIYKTPAFFLFVQSAQYHPKILQQRIQQFIPSFLNQFQQLSPQDFQKLQQSALVEITQQASSLNELAFATFQQAFLYQNFQRNHQIAQHIQNISLQQAHQLLLQTFQSQPRSLQLQLTSKGQRTDSSANNISFP